MGTAAYAMYQGELGVRFDTDDLAQTGDQRVPVGGVVVQMALRLCDRLGCEGSHGGVLGQNRWADGEVTGQTVDCTL